MMAGKFKEYNWKDVQRLLFEDCGLKTEEEQRHKGTFYTVGRFVPPEYEKDTCIKIYVYDKDFSERIEDHNK